MKSVEAFDPRPPEFRGKAAENLPTLVDAVRDHGFLYFALVRSASTCSSPSTANRPSLHS